MTQAEIDSILSNCRTALDAAVNAFHLAEDTLRTALTLTLDPEPPAPDSSTEPPPDSPPKPAFAPPAPSLRSQRTGYIEIDVNVGPELAQYGGDVYVETSLAGSDNWLNGGNGWAELGNGTREIGHGYSPGDQVLVRSKARYADNSFETDFGPTLEVTIAE